VNLELISAIIKLIVMIASYFLDRDKERRARKKGLIKEASSAIRSGNASSVTIIFDKLNR